MTYSKISDLFRVGKDILRRDGLICFIRRVFFFSVRLFYDYQVYYIYQKALNVTSEGTAMPKIQNSSLNIISNPDQVNELMDNGFDINLDLGTEEVKRRLNEGALLFCVFIGQELAHISWVALTNKAKMDFIPLYIDYQNEAYIENCVTTPRYRGMGLYPYTLCQILQFLETKNKTRVKIATQKANTRSIKGITKAGFEIWGSKKLFKILRLAIWKEEPIKCTKY